MRKSAAVKVKQRDITDCGPASVVSVAAYHGTHVSVAQVRQEAGTDKKGTTAFGLVKALESAGLTGKGIRCSESHLSGVPMPAIAHMVLENGLHHFVVLQAVSARHVRLMDPARGKILRMRKRDFAARWTGILIIAAPGRDYQPAGERVTNRSRFLYLMRPHRGIMVQAVIGALVYTLLGFSTSIYIQKLTDYIIAFNLKRALFVAGIVMLVLILFQVVLKMIKNVMVLRVGQLIDARLIMGYYRHLLRLPQRFFDSMRIGEIVSRINDAGKIRQFLSDTSITTILNILILVLSVILMFFFHRGLALLVALILPSYALIYGITNMLNRRQERRLMEKGAELESQLVESLQNIRTVKQLNLDRKMSSAFECRFIDLMQSGYRSGLNSIFSSTSTEFISRVFTLLLLWSASILIFRGELTLGQMLSFYTLLGYMSGPAAGLVGINKVYQNAMIAADRLFEIMDLDTGEAGHIEAEDFTGMDIRFSDVEFSYGGRGMLFNELNLLIPAGSITLLAGESGSGKSTIASLIMGLYQPDSGLIKIGPHRIGHYRTDVLSRQIGIVPQHTDLFAGSLLENIALGDQHPDTEKVTAICIRLGLANLIDRLPGGLNAQVGEKGQLLSGGERQRISIARTIYRDPSILIFDEPTSSLDHRARQLIIGLIGEERDRGRTILLITHNVHEFDCADQVFRLEDGKIRCPSETENKRSSHETN